MEEEADSSPTQWIRGESRVFAELNGRGCRRVSLGLYAQTILGSTSEELKRFELFQPGLRRPTSEPVMRKDCDEELLRFQQR